MRLGPIFRVLGALLYGFIGYELGIALVGSFELTAESAPIVWGATLGGALLGFLLGAVAGHCTGKGGTQRPAQCAHDRPGRRHHRAGQSVC